MNRPKKPPVPLAPRTVVEGARQAIHEPDPAIKRIAAEVRRQLLDLPDDRSAFEDGAKGGRHLRENVCPNGVSPYGQYITLEGVSLEERAEVVRFLPHHIALFRRLTPAPAQALGDLAVKAAERRTVGRWWGRTWKAGVALFLMAYGAAKWGITEWPMLRQIADVARQALHILMGVSS